MKKVREKQAFINDETGAVMTVEATFVFPIMFFVLLFLIYFGNAYYIKSNIDSVVTRYAILGAAECADPQLKNLMKNGSVDTNLRANRDPYRYLFGGHGKSVQNFITEDVKKEINNKGFFEKMQPSVTKCSVKYNNNIIYQSFRVEVQYAIKFPIRFIFNDQNTVLNLSAVAEAPVVDGAEFVLNTNMAIDYVEQTGLPEKIEKLKSQISKFFN